MKEIRLTQGQIALVDDEDFEYLNQRSWCLGKIKNTFYAKACTSTEGKKKTLMMHRVIMNCPDTMQVDHIDHNGLNNQKSNLRICTQHENRMNTKSFSKSGYLGVYVYNNKYKNKIYTYIKAGIAINGKQINLGTFKTVEEAAMEYDKAAKKYFGEFANLNFKQ